MLQCVKSVIGEESGVGVVEDTENSTIIVWFVCHVMRDRRAESSIL
jgi:hypothetical protein